MKPAKVLFFDLDETLLDNSRFQRSIIATCKKLAASHPRLNAARLAEANRMIWHLYWPEVEDKWTLGVTDGASVALEAWRRTLQACGCNDESTAQFALQIHLQLGRETYRLFNDVRDLFTSVRKARFPLALITNGASDTQRDKVRALGIEHWFDVVVVSGEVGIAKPDVSIFCLALNKLAVVRENVWHVGDSLTTDVAGAKATGLTSVWLNRSGRVRREDDPEPDIEIRSLSSLLALLAENGLHEAHC